VAQVSSEIKAVAKHLDGYTPANTHSNTGDDQYSDHSESGYPAYNDMKNLVMIDIMTISKVDMISIATCMIQVIQNIQTMMSQDTLQ